MTFENVYDIIKKEHIFAAWVYDEKDKRANKLQYE